MKLKEIYEKMDYMEMEFFKKDDNIYRIATSDTREDFDIAIVNEVCDLDKMEYYWSTGDEYFGFVDFDMDSEVELLQLNTVELSEREYEKLVMN